LAQRTFFGVFPLQNLASDDHLVALKPIAQQSSLRFADWAYRTAWSSLQLDTNGQIDGYHVMRPGRQTLTLQHARPLVYFNLLISIQWNATDEYLQQIAAGMRLASHYLFDVSDGQMALGQIAIFDDGVNWEQADIQILARNNVRPYAYVGGIHSGDAAQKLVIGRHWSGNSGAEGNWNERNGYRTLVHEFGHYALHLYDSYFEYTYTNGKLAGTNAIGVGCTHASHSDGDDAMVATIMDNQYRTSELSARGIPDLWQPVCEHTVQWQLNKESDWETVLRYYNDQTVPPRWQLESPSDRQRIMPGPLGLPTHWLDFPQVRIDAVDVPAPPIQINVLNADGTRYKEALVALETQRADGTSVILDQGQTKEGQITLYGAAINNTVRAISLAGDRSSSLRIGSASVYSLTLRGHTRSQARDVSLPINPYLSIVSSGDGLHLTLAVHGLAADAEIAALVIPPGNRAQTLALGYSPTEATHIGVVDLANSTSGLGSAHMLGISQPAQSFAVDSDFSLLAVEAATEQDYYTPDGKGWLHLEAGSLPTAQAYLVFMPTGVVPQPLPAAMAVIGNAYSLRVSGSLTTTQQPGILGLFYDSTQLLPCIEPASLQMARWDGTAWTLLPSQLDVDHRAVSTLITHLGIYALLAPATCEAQPFQVQLPIITSP